MLFPVALWMVVISPTGGTPVVTAVGTFGDYTECKDRRVSSKAGRPCFCRIYLHREAAALMAGMANHPHAIDRWTPRPARP